MGNYHGVWHMGGIGGVHCGWVGMVHGLWGGLVGEEHGNVVLAGGGLAGGQARDLVVIGHHVGLGQGGGGHSDNSCMSHILGGVPPARGTIVMVW